MNKVESFTTFNRGQRRKDRREHMRLCRFEMTRVIEAGQGSPKALAMKHLNALSEKNGGYYRGVTLPRKDADGNTYYEVWTKRL